ncbi:MAG: hypothetical protein R3F59_31270 [Myxococcota bacterium]
MTHPSPLALDRLALGAPDPATQAHVDACDACRAHVEAVCAPPPPMSGRIRALRRPRARLVAVAVALAALLVLVRPAPYVGTKGGPTVEVWTRRGDEVARWDGAPLHPGDSLRLRVDPGPHRRVTVLAGADVLYAGAVDGPGALPTSWRLDDAPGPERLRVVLSGGDQPDWTLALDLPKEPR